MAVEATSFDSGKVVTALSPSGYAGKPVLAKLGNQKPGIFLSQRRRPFCCICLFITLKEESSGSEL